MSWQSPVGDWDACGDRFYEKTELYQLGWEVSDFDNQRVCCAREGGPIAVVRDERRIVLVTGGNTRPVLKIFTSAGGVMGALVWDKGSIAGLGWTSANELVVVEVTGEVHMLSMHGKILPKQFSLGQEVANEGITHCIIYPTGLVALSASHTLWSVSGWEDPRPQRLAPMGKGITPPHCIAAIEPAHTLSGCVEVLVATGDHVLIVDADSAQAHAHGQGPLLALAVAPNGSFVASFSEGGRLLVWTADFTKVLSEFETDVTGPPKALAWCGTDSVVVCLEDTVLMVGPYGDCVQYELEGAVHLVPEVDGVRMVTADRHELLRRVPDALQDIFSTGSTSVAATLFDARKMFDEGNAKADEKLRSIVHSLPEAVMNCIAAAGADMDPARQAALLKAAVYGRAFCGAEAVGKLALRDAAMSLRVLNALRSPEVGVPLTNRQLEALTVEGAVQRLVAMHHHFLALKMATAAGTRTDVVLVHWACAKITASQDVPDDKLMAVLEAKLKGRQGMQYAAIAAHARSLGRTSLAASLLDREPRASEQVPLLLNLGEEARALGKAVDSGDPDLVYLALFKMYSARPLSDFLAAISSTKPLARSLFLAYCAKTEPELLEEVLKVQGGHEGLASLRFKEALATAAAAKAASAGTVGARTIRSLDLMQADVLKLIERSADSWGQLRDYGLQSKGAQEMVSLRKLQSDLESETGNACFLGLSAVGTVRQLLRLGNVRGAARVRAELKISDRRFTWLKIRMLGAAKDWEGLEALGREKKLPVGMDVFIAACKAHGAPPATTAKFIARLPEAREKAEEYAAIGMLTEAANAAAQSKDTDMLSAIQGMVGGSSNPLGAAVSQLKDRLSAGVSR
ncbi:hypothetical protein WJX73_008313 [Symbiochloris irregularis]|uniref:Protein VACUOLELESS1 n=1 Tax=Symbiochloris irregularis TaxID=706552 RepID=A0AAW1NLT4_9CHLO